MFVALVFKVALVLIDRGALMTLVSLRVTALPLVLSIMTPPEPVQVAGNSVPVVWAPVPLYCSVALAPYAVTVLLAVAVPSSERMPFIVALVKLFAPESDRVTLLKVYAKGAIDCAPAALKLTVLVLQVNVPAVPLMKVPPTFSVPESEKMIFDEVPAEVIFPVIVTVPVDMVTCVTLDAVAAPLSVNDLAQRVPSLTMICFVLLF